MANSKGKFVYPTIAGVAQIDSKVTKSRGAKISSPTEWLEDLTSENVIKFLVDQDTLASDYIGTCKELKEMKKCLNDTANHTRLSCPIESMGRIFYFMNSTENPGHDSLYVQESVNSKPKVVVSPDQIPGRPAASAYYLRMFSVSLNCVTLAYAFSDSKIGDWMCIRFKNISSGTDYPEELTNVCKSDICWTLDNQGILYSCFPTPNQQMHHKICFHRPGTSQLEDIVFVEFPTNPTVTLQAQLADSGNFLFVYAQENVPIANVNLVHFFYGDFTLCTESEYEWTPMLFHLFEGEQLEVQYITNDTTFTYFRTNVRAPNFKVVKCRLFHTDPLARSVWEIIISEDPNRLLDWVVCVNRSYLMVSYIHEGVSSLELRRLKDGNIIHRYSLPVGTITGCSGHKLCTRFFFTFTSFLIPDRVYFINTRQPRSGFCGPLRLIGNRRIRSFHTNNELEQTLGLSGYCAKHTFCKSKSDHVSIPVFLIYKKGMKMNGNSPCIVSGQGCFGVQVVPSFSLSKLVFMKRFNGMIAVVGVRGGGEKGEKWYHSGCGLNKHNTYDDFVSAVEYLIKSGYTSASKLILEGECLGGNLAGVCMIQRPDLFAAVIIHDGLLDMVEFDKFQQSRVWKTEFGDTEKDECLENVKKLSPLHNLPEGKDALAKLPPVLLIVGTEPSFSHPSNSLKFVAQLQKNLNHHEFVKWKPVLLKMASPRQASRQMDERAEIFAFIMQALQLTWTK